MVARRNRATTENRLFTICLRHINSIIYRQHADDTLNPAITMYRSFLQHSVPGAKDNFNYLNPPILHQTTFV